MKVSLLIPAAGSGSRMGAEVPKPFLPLAGEPVLAHTLRAFAAVDAIHEVVVAVSDTWASEVEAQLNRVMPGRRHVVVAGGAERMESVWNALAATSPESDLVAVHDAVRPFVSPSLIRACLSAAFDTGAAIPGVPVTDTLKRVSDGTVLETVDRTGVFSVQTPQVVRRQWLLDAYGTARREGWTATDEAGLIERSGRPLRIVDGDRANIKLTYPYDMAIAESRLQSAISDIRIGYGYDVHPLAPGRRLVLGGVDIPHERGLVGHSDADVLLHAITDAILGALALGDIGAHFPDTDSVNKDRDSREFVRGAVALIQDAGYRVLNIDATLVAEQPKILPHVPRMRERIAQDAGLTTDRVSIKATTNERLGFQGRSEGMSAMATALLARV
jgi:2-C-methyl-D-erythritol 4-phosphate cytidylyltransferase/2-C-methyl-D-erythritol 2,4-cyclodiphosphate synthase